MIKGIDHLEVTVSDLDRSVDFYTRLMGFDEVIRFDAQVPGMSRISFLKLGECMIELIEMEETKQGEDDPAVPGFKHLCLAVEDFESEVERLKAAGVEVKEDAHVLTGEHLRTVSSKVDLDMDKGLQRAVFADPDGLAVELLQW